MAIKFEGIDPHGLGGTAIANGYEGLQWQNFYALTPKPHYQNSGYDFDIHSGKSVAYNDPVIPASFSSSGSNFTLKSAYLAAAWNNDLTVTVTGFRDGEQVAQQEFVLDPEQTFVQFHGFKTIDSVTVTSTGGTNAGLGGSGNEVAIDDLGIKFLSAATPHQAHSDADHVDIAQHLSGPMSMHDSGFSHWMLA